MTSRPGTLTTTSLRGPRGLWKAMVDQVVVPDAEAAELGATTIAFRVPPAEIRAMAFVASLGPSTPPARRGAGGGELDLAGEEALLGYLARITPPAA